MRREQNRMADRSLRPFARVRFPSLPDELQRYDPDSHIWEELEGLSLRFSTNHLCRLYLTYQIFRVLTGLFLGRIDYQDKNKREKTTTMEFKWQASESLPQSQLTSVVLANNYSPPPGFCFDIYCNDDVRDSITEDLLLIERARTHLWFPSLFRRL